MNIDTIASMTRDHRKVAGLSQSELAELAGVGKTAVFDIEHQKETIRFDVLLKVLNALNISLEANSPLLSSAYLKKEMDAQR
jgi:HTH-type transcriptional regulator / antitoxin HipB